MKTLTTFLMAVVFSFIFVASSASANQRTHLLWVGSELKSGTWTPVDVVTDDAGNLVQLYVGPDPYTVAQVKSGTPVKFDGAPADRSDILTLVGPNITAQNGGDLTMRYLHSGLAGNHYRTLQLQLRKEGNAWKLYMAGQGRPLASLFMTRNSFFGKTIGIDKVQYTTAMLASAKDTQDALALLDPRDNGVDPRSALGEAKNEVPSLGEGRPTESAEGVSARS